MHLKLLKSKIHRARVTGSDLNYEGSIEIDESLMEAVGILPFEQVDIWNLTNGERFSTYAIPAKRTSGRIAVNGAAARKVQVGDEIIISAFALVGVSEDAKRSKTIRTWTPKIVYVDEKNRVLPFPKARGIPH